MEVSYNVSEIDGLTEAHRIVSRLETAVVYCHPAWQKMYRVKEYLKNRQKEELDGVLSDPGGAA